MAKKFLRSDWYAYRSYKNNGSVPGSPANTHQIVINGKFDPRAREVFQSTKEWVGELRNQGYRARGIKIGNTNNPMFAIIFDQNP